MFLYIVTLKIPFIGTNGASPNLFQYDNALVHKARSIKTWFAKSDVKELLT